MNRLNRSWQLGKASWAVLKRDQTLLVYPVASAAALIAIAIVIGIPLFFAGAFDHVASSDHGPAALVGLFLFYFVAYAITFFCNTAMVSVVMHRLEGSDAPETGWAFAKSRIGAILGYAAIAATVGVLLRAVSERSGLAGRIVAALGGAAWSIATFLVVPVLVVENVGPLDSVKRSARLLKQTWGEQILGTTGIGLVTGLASLVVILVGAALAGLFFAIGLTPVAIAVIVVAVAAFALVVVVSSALDAIYKSALYRYATGQPSPAFPAEDLLPGAFRPKG